MRREETSVVGIETTMNKLPKGREHLIQPDHRV